MENNLEKRLEKIENWLQFEQGSIYWEIVYNLIKYGTFLFLLYLLYTVFVMTTTVVLMEQLPLFCQNITN